MAFYQRIGMFIPKSIVIAFKKQMDYVGIEMPELSLVGFIFSFGLAISIGISLNLQVFLNFPMIVTFPLFFLLFAGGIYLWLNMVAEGKGRFVEKVLPDVLQLVASNMKSGLTTERALLAAARPEFGVFSDELKLASARVLAGERIEQALSDISKKIKSQTLERTTWLMIQGIKSGGEVADLLSQLSADLRDQNALKEETKSEISMYVMLIAGGAMLGAPVLFGISSYMVGVIVKQTESISIDPARFEEISKRSSVGRLGIGTGMSQVSITEEFAVLFSEVSLAIILIFASLLVGVLNTGKEKDGVKFMPLMLIMGMAVFFVTRFALVFVLANISGMFTG